MSRPIANIVLFVSSLCVAATAQAQDKSSEATQPGALPALEDSSWQLGVALGYGERGNPLIRSDDLKMLVDLDIAWFGDRWFFDNGDGGLTLKHGDHATLNLIGRFNSDRVFFSKVDSDIVVISATGSDAPAVMERVEVPDRDYALEFGLELLSDGNWGYLQLAAHRDVSHVHEGYEVYANFGRAFRKARWVFEPSFGASWKSRRLNDYYWGVRDAESNPIFPAYRVGAGLNQHARFALSYRLDKHWSFFAVAEYERLSSAAALSPIVDDQDVRGIFAGFSYRL